MRLHYRLTAWLIRMAAKAICGLKIKGIENIPLTGRLIIASNHRSKADPPLIGASLTREVVYAAQIELFRGLTGKLVRAYNAIPVRRSGVDKEAVIEILARLGREEAVLYFPQGGREKDGVVRPPKPGIGYLAVEGKSPIIPLSIVGSEHFGRGWRGWMELITRRGKLTISIGKPVEYQSLSASDDKKESYRLIAKMLMDEIEKLG